MRGGHQERRTLLHSLQQLPGLARRARHQWRGAFPACRTRFDFNRTIQIVNKSLAAMKSKHSALAVSFQGSNEDALSILASNGGSRDGTVRLPITLVIQPKTTEPASLEMVLVGERLSAILPPPGQSHLIGLFADHGTDTVGPAAKEVLKNPGSRLCKLTVTEVDFVAKRSSENIAFECQEMRSFLERLAR
jgi:hypothetical protein